MTHYIALIHKERGSVNGVSFPDVPGVIAAGNSIDEAMQQAAEALAFAAEDWADLSRAPFPEPRTIDDLRRNPDFIRDSSDAIVVAVPLRLAAEPA